MVAWSSPRTPIRSPTSVSPSCETLVGEAERDAWLRHMRTALDEVALEPALDENQASRRAA